MERFLVTDCGLRPLAAEFREPDGARAEPGFELLVSADEKWEELRGILAEQAAPAWSEGLAKFSMSSAEQSVRKSKEGLLEVRPTFERISPKLVYACYRGLSGPGQEYPVRLFFAMDRFVLLISRYGLAQEKLDAWVQSGLLKQPLDLAHLLGAEVLDQHRTRLEQLEEQMDHVEEGILKGPRRWQQERIIALHKRVIGLKRSLNAHESVFARLANLDKTSGRPEWQELVAETQRELDNARQTHELVESLREAYQTAMDNRANDIMKMLTLLATILLPINLLTSFFGMNFEHMPLIHEPYGLTVFYVASGLVACAALAYFWRKRWLR